MKHFLVIGEYFLIIPHLKESEYMEHGNPLCKDNPSFYL